MWSNLNDSFSAITTTLRQSLAGENEQQRELETKLSLLRDEVVRHRSIARLYKERWLKAEQVVKKSTGQCSEIYNDDIDLDGDGGGDYYDDDDDDDQSRGLLLDHGQPKESPSKTTKQQSKDYGSTAAGATSKPPSAQELSLHSSVKRIHELQDEMLKIDADRQHWQALAKQKAKLEDELEDAKNKIENLLEARHEHEVRYGQLVAARDELAAELQLLDTQHQEAMQAVIRMRDQALADLELERQHRATTAATTTAVMGETMTPGRYDQDDDDGHRHHHHQDDDDGHHHPVATVDASIDATCHGADEHGDVVVIDELARVLECPRHQVLPLTRHRLDEMTRLDEACRRLEDKLSQRDQAAATTAGAVIVAAGKSDETEVGLTREEPDGATEEPKPLLPVDPPVAPSAVLPYSAEEVAQLEAKLTELSLAHEELMERYEKVTLVDTVVDVSDPVTHDERVKRAQVGIKSYLVSLLQGLDQKADEIETLRAQLESKEALMEKLKERDETMRQKFIEMSNAETDENEQLEGRIRQLRDEHDCFVSQHETTVEALNQKTQEADELRANLAKAESHAQQLQLNYQTVWDQVQALQKQCDELRQELTQLTEQYSEKDQLLQEANRKCVELSTMNAKVEDDVTPLKVELEQMRSDKTSLEQAFAQLSQQCSEKDRLLEETNRKCAELSTMTAKVEDDVTPLRVELERLRTEKVTLEEKFAQLSQQCSEKDRLLEEANRKCQELSSRAAKVEDDLTPLQVELDGLRSEKINLEQAFAQLGQQCSEKDRLLEEANGKCQELSLLAAKVEDVTPLRIELETLHNEKAKLEEAFTQLRQTLAQKDGELIELRELSVELKEQLAQPDLEKDAEVERLKAELARLRQHMVMVEENYTGEMVTLEANLEEARAQVQRLEAFNAEVQQYQEQIRNLQTQRDKARNEVSALEDKLQQYSTSIANLQAVIEQLDKEHERKIKSIQAEHQAQLDQERSHTDDVLRKLQYNEERLRETLEALEAASRLSETVDQKQIAIEQMKREVKKREQEIEKLHHKIAELNESTEGKVDKQIVKNLVISYLATPAAKKSEGERLLARFLDFNQEEMNRAGVRIGKDARPSESVGVFTSKFLEFLENESKPETASPQPPERKLSTASQPAVNELARDLNKRFTAPGPPSRMVNPFVAPMPPAMYRSSQCSSRRSSTDSLHNQLLAVGQATPPHQVTLVSAPAEPATTTTTPSIVDVVRNAVEKEKFI